MTAAALLKKPWFERFWANVVQDGDCWIWTGTHHSKPGYEYGQICIKGKQHAAHRVSYRMWKGPIPPGTELDHLCRLPPCVNPRHLEAVPHQVNITRGRSWQAEKATCPRGHPLTLLHRNGKDPSGTPRMLPRCQPCQTRKGRRALTA
ncbi:MAG: HNH endonuclease [Chloroflexi bacterium]|nr:HNH endonuclease [Chloroflexota bacterium]